MADDMRERVARAIWGSPAAKRIVKWDELDEKTKELWRQDADRVFVALEEGK